MKSIEEIKKDYTLFVDIQIGKYLKRFDKSEFSNKAEAELVITQIVNIYNKKVASDQLRLDKLSEHGKTAWFNSIEIDFSQRSGYNEAGGSIFEYVKFFDEEFQKISNYFYERFPFLPEGSMGVLIFIGPALEAYGLPFERFKTLLLGENEYTKIEEDILLWAFNLTMNIMGSIFERSKKTRKQFYLKSLKTAQVQLSKKDSIMVVDKIAANIKNFEENPAGGKNKVRKKQ